MSQKTPIFSEDKVLPKGQATKRITATVAKAMFAELIRRVQFGSERIVIQNHGQDAVAVVPIEDLQK